MRSVNSDKKQGENMNSETLENIVDGIELIAWIAAMVFVPCLMLSLLGGN